MQVVLLDKERRKRVVMEEEVGLVDEAHVGSFLSCGENLPTDVKWPHFHVLAGAGGIRLALVVCHHLVFSRPHAEVVDHLERTRIEVRGQTEESRHHHSMKGLGLLYLSDVLIGGEDDLIKSWGRDLDSLFESDGHHGSLIEKMSFIFFRHFI